MARSFHKRPLYNWDLLAYMAVIDNYREPLDSLHKTVYSEAKKNIPGEDFKLIISSNEFRQSCYRNPQIFYQQLPLYAVKPFYTITAYLFFVCGINLVMSTVMPSILAFISLALLLLIWLQKYFSNFFSICASLLIMALPPVIEAGRLSSPDLFSTFFICWGIYLLLEIKSLPKSLIIFYIGLFTRIDNIIFLILLFTALKYNEIIVKKITYFFYTIIISVLLFSCFIMSLEARKYGWDILFYPSFLHHLNTSHITSPFDIKQYLALIRTQLGLALHFTFLPAFLIISTILFVGKTNLKHAVTGPEQMLTIILLVSIIVRLILQPVIADRFYLTFYILISVFLLKKYSGLVSAKNLNEKGSGG